MSTNYRSTPRFAFDGIKDVSQRVEQSTPEARPQHLPHFFLWAQKGKLIPQVMSGGDASKTFGSKTFDLRSNYATHQTVFANVALENANMSMLQRLVPDDAAKGSMRLSVIVKTVSGEPIYSRDVDGNVNRDGSGNIIMMPDDKGQSGSDTIAVQEDGDNPGSPLPVASINYTGTELEAGKWLPVTTTYPGSTVLGQAVSNGDKIYALVDNPSKTQWTVGGVTQWGINVEYTEVTVNQVSWVLEPVPTSGTNTFGNATVSTLSVSSPVISHKKYPAMDLLGEFGSASNLYGLTFSAPTISSSISVNDDAVVSNLAYVYRLMAKRKAEENVSASVVSTNSGDQFIDFTFKAGAIDPNTDAELDLNTAYFKNYENKNVSPRQYADLDAIHVYSDFIADLLEDMELIERQALIDAGVCNDEEDTYAYIPENGSQTINFMSGKTYDDKVYESVRLVSSGTPENTSMSTTWVQYLTGGSDGTMDQVNFEAAIRNVFANYDDYVISYLPSGDPDPRDIIIDFTDIARWPQSAYWDSGFSTPTKTAMTTALVRPNVYVVLATHGIGSVPNDDRLLNGAENGIAVGLVSSMRLHPESELYGTGCCRGIVHLQSGKLLQGPWKKYLPLSLDLLNVISQYMGAGDGIWKPSQRFDIGDNKIISMFDVDTVNYDKNLSARAQDWLASTVYVQSFDRNQLMRPGVQTVYGDATSVLNSFLTVAAACEIITICHRVWAEFTGIQTMQGQELLGAIDERMAELLSGNKFDGTVVIETSSQYTARDENNGYSWTTNVLLRGPNMKTVGNFTVTSDRMEDTSNG